MKERFQSKAAQEASEQRKNAIEGLKLEALKGKIANELQLEEADYKELSGEEALEVVGLRLGVIKRLASEHLDGLDSVAELAEYEIEQQFSEICKMAAITDWPAEKGRVRHLSNQPASQAAVDELVGLYLAKMDRQTEDV